MLKKVNLIKLFVILLSLASIYLITKNAREKFSASSNETKCVTVIIKIDKLQINESHNLCTNKNYLGELLDENSDSINFTTSGKKSDLFGRLVESFNNYQKHGNEFFFIYVDNVYGNFGIDQQPLKDGSIYEFRLGTY